MFLCGKCGKTTEPREKLTKKPILIRVRVYEYKKIIGKKEIPGASFGKEIVKEIDLCEACSAKEASNG